MIKDELRGYNKAIALTVIVLGNLIADDRIPRHTKPILSSIKENFKELYITEEELRHAEASETPSD